MQLMIPQYRGEEGGYKNLLINKIIWATQVAEYGVQKLNFRVQINCTENL